MSDQEPGGRQTAQKMPLQPDDIKVQKAQDSFHTHSPTTYTHNTLTTQGESKGAVGLAIWLRDLYVYHLGGKGTQKRNDIKAEKEFKVKSLWSDFFFK